MKLANAIITFLGVLLVTSCLTADASAQRERNRRSASKVKLSHLTYKTVAMKSQALKRQVNYSVFLPKGYDAEDNQDTRYPTIFFLHGMWEDHQRFYSRGGAPVLDKMVGDGSIPPVIFICVNDFSRGSFYINGKRMKVEDMVLKEMIPHVAKTYRCKAGRSNRALLGVSMGGFGALKIAFKHPQVFGVVASHSAAILPEDHTKLLEVFPWAARYSDRMIKPVFGSPVDQELWAAENPLTLARQLDTDSLNGLKIYFDCGDADRYKFDKPNEELHKVLTKNGIRHTWRLVKGGNHGWNSRQTPTGYNQTALPHSLRFIAAAWSQKKAIRGLSDRFGGDGKK
jgi:enterochelin esterase-like enzyme